MPKALTPPLPSFTFYAFTAHPQSSKFSTRTLSQSPCIPDPDRGVRLTPDGLRSFLATWEQWWDRPVSVAGTQRPARDILFEQARRLARVLRAPAEPYLTVPIEAWLQLPVGFFTTSEQP